MKPHIRTAWGILWREDNKLDGKREYLMCTSNGPIQYKTRAEARAHVRASYGYIADQPDLKQEPHGWKMPTAVKIHITTRLA